MGKPDFWTEFAKFFLAIFVAFAILAPVFSFAAYQHCTDTACDWPMRRARLFLHFQSFFIAAVPVAFLLAWIRVLGSGGHGSRLAGMILCAILIAALLVAWPWILSFN